MGVGRGVALLVSIPLSVLGLPAPPETAIKQRNHSWQ
jgi:hypothetical protein